MSDLTQYRILKKADAAVLLAVLLLGGMGIVLAVSGWADTYTARMSALAEIDPNDAAAVLARQLRIVAVLNGTVILVFAVFISWYGFRGVRTRSMPPVGAWIIEGQRVRTGPRAVMVSKAMVVGAAVLAVLAIASTFIFWELAAQMQATGVAS